jgi:hypothetical protein
MSKRLDTEYGNWRWGYEESGFFSYYHVYDDEGMVAYFGIPRTEANDIATAMLCLTHNNLKDKEEK